MYFEEAPKTSRMDLYDFEEPLRDLLRALRAGARLTTIIGLRRTGKTSLLLTCLNEAGLPYIVIDARVFAREPTISRTDLTQTLERALNDFLAREEGWARRVLDWLKAIRGVEISLEPPKISLAWGPSSKEAADLPAIFESLGRLAEKRRTRFMIALDEAQEFRKLVGYDLVKLLAHVYDYVRGVQLIATGSQVGFLRDFLGAEDPRSPFYGRPRATIEMPHLSADEAGDFLRLGFKQIGMRPDERLLEETVGKLNGIIGWLTYVGVVARARGRFDRKILEQALEEGARLAAEEFGNFLASRPLAKRRYVVIIKRLAEAGRAGWAELKRGLEAEEGRRVADNVFNGLLENLVKGGFIRKGADGAYSVADMVLAHALRGGFVMG